MEPGGTTEAGMSKTPQRRAPIRKQKNLCQSPGCSARALLRRPRTNQSLCRECFYLAFETEVHETICANKLFSRGERVALAASGGKDSTVLAHVVTLLNERYDYGLDLCLLSIDEGISGYRDDSLDTVKRNEQTYGIPLHVFSYKDLYGWTMDEIVKAVGTKNNCTFCGVFRRQALDRGAHLIGVSKMATGHNADDIAETVLLNMIRNDVPRLGRCGSAMTGEAVGDDREALPRVKPFKFTYEKEIVMYAYFKKLDYFSTECKYSPFAARGLAREFVKDLEAARSTTIIDLVKSADRLRLRGGNERDQKPPGTCTVCGYLSSQAVCKACLLLEGLNTGMPLLGIANGRRRHRRVADCGTVTGAVAGGEADPLACGGSGSCGGGGCRPATGLDEFTRGTADHVVVNSADTQTKPFAYMQNIQTIAKHPMAANK
jgi:cytoplasmic tRNA 2-thiolation protein 1